MPRIARAIAVDFPHHVTQRGNNRGVVFFDEEDRQFYLATLKKYSAKYRMEIWAYCLMDNHVHILAVPRASESLAKGIGITNLVYTQYLNRKLGNSGRVWQNRFFSCPVESETYLWSVARYIEANPVQASIVQAAEDYPWSSARAHLAGHRDPVLHGEAWLGPHERVDYALSFRSEDQELDEIIRQRTSSGLPLGSEPFMETLEKRLGCRLRPGKRGRPKKGGENGKCP